MDDRIEIRLNKFLSEAGVCSRRQADAWIADGRVTVDGQPALLGRMVLPGQRVEVDGRIVGSFHGGHDGPAAPPPVLLAVNKPRGIVCTTSDKDRAPNIVDMINYPARIYPIGRLDKDSEGLILMTNQGDLVNKMMRSGNAHEKEYLVTIDRPVTEAFLKQMRKGVPILDTVTLPCRAEQTGTDSFRIILTQGLNRQIRRMCEYLGCHVRTLKRVRIMNITLGQLNMGQYRVVEGKEYLRLLNALSDSTNLSRSDMGNAASQGSHESGSAKSKRCSHVPSPARSTKGCQAPAQARSTKGCQAPAQARSTKGCQAPAQTKSSKKKFRENIKKI